MKRILTAAVVLTVVLAAASCGQRSSDRSVSENRIPEKVVTPEMEMDNAMVSEAIRSYYASDGETRARFPGTDRWMEYTSRLCYDPVTQSQDPQPAEVLVSRADAPDNAFEVKWRSFGKAHHIILVFAVEGEEWRLDNIIEDVDEGNREPLIDYSRPASDYDDFAETAEE